MRVVVSSVEDCYRALGIVHELWRPLPGRMKDYIAFPKPNGYQSIHTTVTTTHGTILEIQIRTRKMHHESEFGIASHLIYKQPVTTDHPAPSNRFFNLIPALFRPFAKDPKPETIVKVAKSMTDKEKIPQWISQIGQLSVKKKGAEAEFIKDLQQDFFSLRIFVFTPKGDVVDLPVGATPIDFAYAIHSEIGNHIAGVKVNKKLVQLDTELHNGDIVDVTTRKSALPTKKWIGIAKTSAAKRHIRIKLGIQPPK